VKEEKGKETSRPEEVLRQIDFYEGYFMENEDLEIDSLEYLLALILLKKVPYTTNRTQIPCSENIPLKSPKLC
jgi:hypothetical protein